MSLRILLVEDDENKRSEVRSFLEGLGLEIHITEARSHQSALRCLQSETFDRIIMDMTMPTFDISPGERGGDPQAYGGQDLLRFIKRRKVTTPVVVLSMFDRFGEGENLQTLQELDDRLRQEHISQYKGVVYYNVADESWKESLAEFVKGSPL